MTHLATGQQRWAYQRAAKYLESVMMDPSSPTMLKEIIRQHNAVGLLFLQQLMATFHLNEEKEHDGL